MTDLASVAGRLATDEWTIRLLYASDPHFKVLCDDFAIALRAFDHWRTDAARAEEYRQIAQELEDEIREYLDMRRRVPGGRGLP